MAPEGVLRALSARAELERVLAFLEQGGVERARAALHEQRLQEVEKERRVPAPVPRPRLERHPHSPIAVLVDLLLDWF